MRNLRWLAGALVLALVALGLWGTASLGGDVGARLYRVLQLFFVEGDWIHDVVPLPWQIQLVRFVAPIFLVAGLALLFVRGTLTALHNATVRFARGHLIVVGINELSRPSLRSCQRAGERLEAYPKFFDHADDVARHISAVCHLECIDADLAREYVVRDHADTLADASTTWSHIPTTFAVSSSRYTCDGSCWPDWAERANSGAYAWRWRHCPFARSGGGARG